MKKSRIILVAGGTAGHIFPALSVIRTLKDKGYTVTLMTNRGDFSLYFQDVDQVCLMKTIGMHHGTFSFCVNLMRDVFQCFSYFFRYYFTIHSVWGFGSYTSFPALVSARIMGLSTGLHQSDKVWGKANRFFGSFVKKIATGFFYDTENPAYTWLKQKTWQWTKTPVRDNIRLYHGKMHPKSKDSGINILILGGSLGAKVWTDYVPKALSLLPESIQKNLSITHQVHTSWLHKTEDLYKKTWVTFQCSSFIQNIEQKIFQADLILSRAGASTLAEIATIGRACLMMPYPRAKNNHQYYNACAFKTGGWVVQEKEDFSVFFQIFCDILYNPKVLSQKAEHMRRFSCHMAHGDLVRFMLE